MTDGARSGLAGTSGAGQSQTQGLGTEQVPAHEREGYWKEAILDAIASVDLASREAEGFRRDILWRFFALRGASPLREALDAHVRAVGAALERLAPESRSALLETTIDLIALAFTDEVKSFAGDGSTVRRALVLRAMRHIDGHLADPGLSAASVAAALGVSTGYLQHVFQSARTTVGAHVRRRRLERCRDDLADPLRAREHVAEIAMRWGFGDMPHFSRAFRERFGLSPRAHRAHAASRRNA